MAGGVPPDRAVTALCRHCSAEIGASAREFCCSGCEAAYNIISGLGLDRYYRQRRLDPSSAGPRPDPAGAPTDVSAYVRTGADGVARLDLMVDGLQCGACLWLIESVLAREPGVVAARTSLATRRLALSWHAGAARPEALIARVAALGYRLAPFDPTRLVADGGRHERELLRSMAVAGFAAGNVMLLSVSVWSGHAGNMSEATRDLLHWLSALIALPAIAYAGRPFFRSAIRALASRRTNMDVPISLAVILAPAISVAETMRHAQHAYFDSAVTLLFFLLIGRYLESRARGRARGTAAQLVALNAEAATVIGPDGGLVAVPPALLQPGMVVICPAGARVAGDGRILDGSSEVDTSLVTGEAAPAAVAPGDAVFAGTLNIGQPLRIGVTAAGKDTLLAEITRLMEAAEQGRARYVALADRVARAYSPMVHGLALATLLGWLWFGAGWHDALLYAVAVLIVTCPCALALAVPVVQVVASGRLLRRGVLLKSPDGLERLAAVDTVVMDKTGTLTLGRLELTELGCDEDAHALAASIAAASNHPLARVVSRSRPRVGPATGVREIPGAGLAMDTPAGEVRLGNRAWCAVPEEAEPCSAGPELWLTRPGWSPLRFDFADRLRPDAAATVARLRSRGFDVRLLSGDRELAVAAVAAEVGIDQWRSGCTPADKSALLDGLAADGHCVLMVGDGLNDAPALAAASVSMSPGNAVELSQTTADMVFQGERLSAVVEALDTARRADRLIKQNFALSLAYNLLAVPLAVLGFATPLVAAAAMSGSSLLVIGNALRLGWANEEGARGP